MTPIKPKAKHKPPPPPPPKRKTMTTQQQHDEEPESTQDQPLRTTAKDAATEPPRHYSGGTIVDDKPVLEGRDVPKPGQLQPGDQEQFDNAGAKEATDEEVPPAPAGIKPNYAVQLPPGSINAPSSIPGGTPPVDVVVPVPEEEPEAEEGDEK